MLCYWACVGLCPGADTIILADGTTHVGTFAALGRGQIEFHPLQAPKIQSRLNRVTALELDPPISATIKLRGGKTLKAVTVTRYRESQFDIAIDGRPQYLPEIKVSDIKPDSDLSRAMAHAASHPSPTTTPGKTWEEQIQTGVVTIVHFHMPAIMASVRQGNYVEKLSKDGGDDVVLIRVTLNGWDDDQAKRYAIQSAPQFWFYNRQGEQTVKLTDRFTSDDLDDALRAASRQKHGHSRIPSR
ncbi:MAG: hypothetical protein O3A51_03580 [Verrucomicrobia bacterium]|nr:hypothetical protein [Verrucomicrobiota bacterium]